MNGHFVVVFPLDMNGHFVVVFPLDMNGHFVVVFPLDINGFDTRIRGRDYSAGKGGSYG